VPVVLGDTDRDADRFRFTLADDVVVVETAQKLDDGDVVRQREAEPVSVAFCVA